MSPEQAAWLDRLIDGDPTPTPPTGGGLGGRMTEEQVQRYKDLAQSRRLTADETRALRAEERALREEISKTKLGSEEEVDARKRLADVEAALAGKKEKKKKRERDAEADELARFRQISQERSLSARETAHLEAIQERLTRAVEGGNLSLEAEAKARQKLADIQRIFDEPREREIRLLSDISQLRHLHGEEIFSLSRIEDQLRAALSAKNLELEREILLRRQLAEVTGALASSRLDGVQATTQDQGYRSIISGPRMTLQDRDDVKSQEVMRHELAMLQQIAQWRTLSRDEAAAAAAYEERIERALAAGNLNRHEALQLEQDLAAARELSSSAFTWDNVWESMVSASGAAGELVAESWLDVFERVFEGGMNLRDFMTGMWDGVAGGLGKAIKAEATLEAKKAGVNALKAGATGTLALARHDYVAATKAFNAVPMFIAEAAGWAALGGAAGAIQHESGGGRGGGSNSLDRGGPDAGLDAARRIESHIYVRNTINVNPLDPNSPLVQDFVHTTARNVIDRQGADAFTVGTGAPS